MARKSAAKAQAALDRAQDLLHSAWELRTAKRRIAVAERAIAISPICADAYVLLAEHAEPGSDAALDLWERGLEAGKQALGNSFADYEGAFWGFLETRPYMRARFGLGHALWERGARDEAIGHLQGMLELNPNDNQGVRYILAAWLLDAGRDDDLRGLLAEYPEDEMAAWSWTAALAAFRRDGDGAQSRRLLGAALKENGYIPAYLYGERRLPKTLPAFICPGEEDEAMHYAADFGSGWHMTPGALDWLRARSQAVKPARHPAPPKAKAA